MDPLAPQRLREAAETMDAYWQSWGREYGADDLREFADQIESERGRWASCRVMAASECVCDKRPAWGVIDCPTHGTVNAG